MQISNDSIRLVVYKPFRRYVSLFISCRIDHFISLNRILDKVPNLFLNNGTIVTFWYECVDCFLIPLNTTVFRKEIRSG